jgi:hypothetical protein
MLPSHLLVLAGCTLLLLQSSCEVLLRVAGQGDMQETPLSPLPLPFTASQQQQQHLLAKAMLFHAMSAEKPYAALFQALFNSSGDSTHYPTDQELQTVLQNKLLRPVADPRNLPPPSTHRSNNAGDSIQEIHYRSLVVTFLGDSFPPRLVLEMNCDQDRASEVGLWGSLLLLARAASAPLDPAVTVICANNWHLPDILTAASRGDTDSDMESGEDMDSKRRWRAKQRFLHHLHAHQLHPSVLPIALGAAATTTTTWLSQFQWRMDVVHFNEHSCESFIECVCLAQSSLALLRPGGLLTVHTRVSAMTEALRALSSGGLLDREAESELDLVQSELYVGVIWKKGQPDSFADDPPRQNPNPEENALFADMLLRADMAAGGGGAGCCEDSRPLSGSRDRERERDRDICRGEGVHSLGVQALNLVEAHLDARQLPRLVDVINANHPRTGDISAEELLSVYELWLGAYQCSPPSPERRLHLGAHMAAESRSLALADLDIEPDSVWRSIMSSLLQAQQTRYDCFHRYYDLQLHPAFFHWEEYLTTGVRGPIFNALMQHPDYPRLRAAHKAGRRFVAGVVPDKDAYAHNGTIYRPGRWVLVTYACSPCCFLLLSLSLSPSLSLSVHTGMYTTLIESFCCCVCVCLVCFASEHNMCTMSFS